MGSLGLGFRGLPAPPRGTVQETSSCGTRNSRQDLQSLPPHCRYHVGFGIQSESHGLRSLGILQKEAYRSSRPRREGESCWRGDATGADSWDACLPGSETRLPPRWS